MHSYMAGRVVVKAPEEYAAWMKQEETLLAGAAAADAPAKPAKPAAKAKKT